MNVLFAMSLLIGLISCADSSFKAGGAKTESVSVSPGAADALPEPQPVEAETEVLPVPTLEVTAQLCLAAINGEETSVINISQGDINLADIEPNAIVLIDLSGQASVDLAKEEVAKLGGLCIAATGRSSVSVDLSAVVATMFYYGRGGAATLLNFKESGSLAALATDVSGASSLTIEGEKVDCESLAYDGGGSSSVACNGVLF